MKEHELLESHIYENIPLCMLMDGIKATMLKKERKISCGVVDYIDSGIKAINIFKLGGYWKVNYYG